MIKKTEQEIMKNWQENLVIPVVSVCTITYNHEQYISEALDSFLMQETDFPFEIVIDDDASPDGTSEVIKKYIEKYPNIINANLREVNVGMMQNFMDNMQRAKGEFVALCEGDDYWTDSLKLQKQADFLKNNNSYSAISHQSKIIKNSKEVKLYSQSLPNILDMKYFLRGTPFHTATVVFRNEIVMRHPLPNDILSGDQALFILLCSFGEIYYIDTTMSIYRQHSGGISYNVPLEIRKKNLNIVPWIMSINPMFPKYKYLSYIYERMLHKGNKSSLLSYIKNYFLFSFYSFSFFPKNLIIMLLVPLKPLIIKLSDKSSFLNLTISILKKKLHI